MEEVGQGGGYKPRCLVMGMHAEQTRLLLREGAGTLVNGEAICKADQL
jgi:hypothetical protein